MSRYIDIQFNDDNWVIEVREDVMASKYDAGKLREMLLYIVSKTADKPNVGATLLNKILVDCDFTAYKQLGEAISWQRVQHQTNGPICCAFVPAVDHMIARKELEAIDATYHKKSQKRYKALVTPDLTDFSEQEISVIDNCIDRWKDLNATEASELSHKIFGGWQFTDNGEDIPYSSAWFSMYDLTPEAKDYALGLSA